MIEANDRLEAAPEKWVIALQVYKD